VLIVRIDLTALGLALSLVGLSVLLYVALQVPPLVAAALPVGAYVLLWHAAAHLSGYGGPDGSPDEEADA
jgi:hypothetical protein